MASLVRRLLDRAPVPRPSRAQRRALRECADNALVMAWLHEHGGIRPLEAFAVEVPLSWRRRRAALRRLAKASGEPAYCCGRPENHDHPEPLVSDDEIQVRLAQARAEVARRKEARDA